MKRIAVVMSGLPRFCKDTTDFINHVFHEFSYDRVDWYFHLWNPQGKDDRFLHESFKILEFEKTKALILSHIPVTHHFEGLQIGIYQNEYQDPSLIENPSTPPLHLSALRADLMRQCKERQEGFEYDIVIRGRLDIVAFGRLNRPVFPKHMLVPSLRYWGPPNRASEVNDWFALGTSSDMTIYTSFIEKVQTYRPQFMNPPMVSEVMLACHLNTSGIISFTDPSFSVQLRRCQYILENKPYLDYGDWINEKEKQQ